MDLPGRADPDSIAQVTHTGEWQKDEALHPGGGAG